MSRRRVLSARLTRLLTTGPVAPLAHLAPLMQGPVTATGCALPRCGHPRHAHRSDFMDLTEGAIDHEFVAAAPLPLAHEYTPALIVTEWNCHACGEANDVWGEGATDGYMQCGSCEAWSWLIFAPEAFGEEPKKAEPVPVAAHREGVEVPTSPFLGTRWRDANGHILAVTRVHKTATGFDLYGTISGCTCTGWMGRVHTSPDEFPDYHQCSHAHVDGFSTRRRRIFGWDRISQG